MNDTQKCSNIAIIGAPNAGKSTLLNKLIGYKVSIVSPKINTTRNIINGIYTENNTQLIFIDTPGIFLPNSKKKIEQAMVKAAWSELEYVNHIALVIDCKKGLCDNTQIIIDHLLKKNFKDTLLILNKIDLLPPKDLEILKDQFKAFNIFKHIFTISALKEKGVKELREYFLNNAPLSPWVYIDDEITNVPLRFITAEMTREQLFLRLEEELPYSIMVETEKWEELDNGGVKIYQVIYTPKASHKTIILGKHGSSIKAIGTNARLEIEKFLDRKVHLFLFVKVKENLLDNLECYNSIYKV